MLCSGGGYAYRLWYARVCLGFCARGHVSLTRVRHSPADQPLTESCFQKHHLEFARDKQQLVFANGSRIAVPEPVFVNEGTAPAGATWSRLPLPGVGC